MPSDIVSVVKKQRAFFHSGQTRPLEFREEQLGLLHHLVQTNEEKILRSLKEDLNKNPFEAFGSEVGLLYDEIRHARKHLKSWARPKRVSSPLTLFPASSYIYSEPLGVVLIIAPWNYPFQLLLAPLVAAISAGNCAVLKPSELAPATSRLIAEILPEAFPDDYITVIEGGVETSHELLEQKFDHIFFTGGTAVGRIVMQAAAKHLTPVTLELGGKSPCLIDENTNLDLTAKRLTWGKFFNAGQTCVSPDYVLVPTQHREELVAKIQAYLVQFFGSDPAASPSYGRIINAKHYERLKELTSEGKLAIGGEHNARERYLAPTVLTEIGWESKVMQDEIFGPVLPILTYDNFEAAVEAIRCRPKPLALYFFSQDESRQKRVLEDISFGGGCINDTLVHLSNPNLPFGGVGDSGMGAYHGTTGFDTFSHRKSVVRQTFKFDQPLRYPPYREDRIRLLKLFQK